MRPFRNGLAHGVLQFSLALWPWLAHGDPLRVASYNLENYNLTNRMTADGFAREAPKPEKQKDALRSVLRALNADLLAVQEIGGPAFVEELRRDLATAGLHYPHTVTLPGPDPHRQLAFLSKKPLVRTARLPRLVTGFHLPSPGDSEALVNRGLLGVTIRTGGRDLQVFTVHLKSRLTRDKRDPRAEGERQAEAAALMQSLGPALPTEGAAALLLGDFNDGPNTATLATFTRGAPGFIRLEAPDARGETWTYRNDKKGFFDRSDYAFVTPALHPRVTRARAYDHPLTHQASDHRPVVVDLDFPDAPGKTPAPGM